MFWLVLEQVLKFFCFMLLGFVFKKSGLLPADTTTVLSKLEVNLFLPAVVFSSFAQHFTVETFRLNAVLLLISACIVAASIAIGIVFARFTVKDPYHKKVVAYTLVVPNVSYVGIPLIMALYGNEAVMRVLIFMIPMLIYTNVKGYRMLMDKDTFSRKSFLNPQVIAMVVGMVVGLTQITLPHLANEVIAGCSNCLSPVAMLLTGCVIAGFDMKKIVSNLLIYKVVLMRMVVLPLLFILSAKALHFSSEILLTIVAVHTMPTGLNTVIFPISAGKECSLGAGMTCISNVLAIGLIPLFFYLFL